MDAEIDAIIELSRLEIDRQEYGDLCDSLKKIIGYFEIMSGVDVQSLPLTTHALPAHNRLRKDEPRTTTASQPSSSHASPKELLARAPQSEDNFFVIPNLM